jgi:hypothetical protein
MTNKRRDACFEIQESDLVSSLSVDVKEGEMWWTDACYCRINNQHNRTNKRDSGRRPRMFSSSGGWWVFMVDAFGEAHDGR